MCILVCFNHLHVNTSRMFLEPLADYFLPLPTSSKYSFVAFGFFPRSEWGSGNKRAPALLSDCIWSDILARNSNSSLDCVAIIRTVVSSEEFTGDILHVLGGTISVGLVLVSLFGMCITKIPHFRLSTFDLNRQSKPLVVEQEELE
jgi:hypothetical protein